MCISQFERKCTLLQSVVGIVLEWHC